MDRKPNSSQALAAAITQAASKQSYYTIRFFADRERVANAYRAYGYLRWVDDVLDTEMGDPSEKIDFVNRQKCLLETCYRGTRPNVRCAQEGMLIDLIASDTEENSGLQIYLRSMMDVMMFDARRRGQIISQQELREYSRNLATGVTEALYYFIGHNEPVPCLETRYLAVTAAHITHMLRDAYEDTRMGYFNIPGEYLQTAGILPDDVNSEPYREWVCARVQLARRYFALGRESFTQLKNWRRRLAGYAYTARFEWMLDVIERENYCLRCEYPERRRLRAGLWMGARTLGSMFASPRSL